jgi:hypothetical protein
MPPAINMSAVDLATFRRASGDAITDILIDLSKNFDEGRWLNKSNRYRARAVPLIARHTSSPRPRVGRINQRDLSRYIAASGFLHSMDGWAYLGRSLDAIIKGDSEASRHLAYYAELRAAMSLLASEGIGIFSSKHFVVENPFNCTTIPSVTRSKVGTHEVSWIALDSWAKARTSGNMMAEIIGANSLTLREWMVAFGAGLHTPVIASSWLRQWGLDLRKLRKDRDARNESSYRPKMLGYPNPLSASEVVNSLGTIWRMMAPESGSSYIAVDRYLIRSSLEAAFLSITGQTSFQDPAQFEARVDRMLEVLSIGGLSAETWRSFFTRATYPDDPLLLKYAGGGTDPSDAYHHLYMVSRSCLLLRIASGMGARRLAAAGISREKLSFWWSPIGLGRGLWLNGSEPEGMDDLWVDVSEAVEDIETWELDRVEELNDGSLIHLRRSQAAALVTLGECERIGLWSLGL